MQRLLQVYNDGDTTLLGRLEEDLQTVIKDCNRLLETLATIREEPQKRLEHINRLNEPLDSFYYMEQPVLTDNIYDIEELGGDVIHFKNCVGCYQGFKETDHNFDNKSAEFIRIANKLLFDHQRRRGRALNYYRSRDKRS